MENQNQNPSQKKGTVTLHEIRIRGNQLVDKVKELIEDGNARRLIIKKDERTVMELPMSVGVGGAAVAIWFAPVLAALGALAALMSDVTIIVEQDEPPAGGAGGTLTQGGSTGGYSSTGGYTGTGSTGTGSTGTGSTGTGSTGYGGSGTGTGL